MFKLIKWLFYTVLFLVVAAAAGVYIFLSTFDLNKYKGQISEIVEKQLHRKLAINGDASVGISLVPTIIVNDVELSNADWSTNPQMLKVKSLEVSFAILPLLKKQIVIEKVALVSPQVFLEVNKVGKANWDFTTDTAKTEEIKIDEAPKPEASIQSANHPAMALLAGFAARSVSVTDAYIQYDDHKAGKFNKVNIHSVNFAAADPDAAIKADFDVNVDGNDIKADMTLGSLNDLIDEKPFPVVVAIKAFGVDLKLSGKLENIFKQIAFALNIQLYNPDGNMGAPEANLNTDVAGNLKVVKATINLLEVAKNKINGEVSADIAGKVPSVKANLKSDLIDLTRFAAKKTAWVMPEMIASAQALSSVPADKVPFDLMGKANAKVDLDVKRLIVQEGMEATNVIMKAVLDNGDLQIVPLTLNFGGGDIDATLNANASSKQVVLKMTSKNMLIQNLHKEFAVTNTQDFGILKGGNLDVDINLVTNGDTYRQMSERLAGSSVIIVNESTVQTGKLEIIKAPLILQVLDMLKVAKSVNKELDLRCAVVRTDFGNGKAKFPKGIAVESKQLNLVSDGAISLVDDGIDFGIQPIAGKIDASSVATLLSSFAKIKGTINEPKVTLDEKQAMKTAAGVLAAGPAFAASSMLLDSNSAPCYEALKGTKYADKYPAPKGVSATSQDVYKDTAAAVKQTGKDIEKSVRDIRDGTKGDLNNLKSSAKDLLGAFKKKK